MVETSTIDPEEEKLKKILESNEVVKFILDTNVIFAYLNAKDQFHVEAKTAVDALSMKGAYFLQPSIILGEVIAHNDRITGKQISTFKAITRLNKFNVQIKNVMTGGPAISTEHILKSYIRHAKHKNFTKLGFSDFMILTLIEEIPNVRILTCDKKMCKYGRSIFEKRIYYLPNSSSDLKSDFVRLMADIQNNFFRKK